MFTRRWAVLWLPKPMALLSIVDWHMRVGACRFALQSSDACFIVLSPKYNWWAHDVTTGSTCFTWIELLNFENRLLRCLGNFPFRSLCGHANCRAQSNLRIALDGVYETSFSRCREWTDERAINCMDGGAGGIGCERASAHILKQKRVKQPEPKRRRREHLTERICIY